MSAAIEYQNDNIYLLRIAGELKKAELERSEASLAIPQCGLNRICRDPSLRSG